MLWVILMSFEDKLSSGIVLLIISIYVIRYGIQNRRIMKEFQINVDRRSPQTYILFGAFLLILSICILSSLILI